MLQILVDLPILVDDATVELMPPSAELPSQPNLPAADEPEPSEEPSRPPSMPSQVQVPPLDPEMQVIYEPAGPNDRFRLQRLQHERNETLVLPLHFKLQ